MGTYKTNWQLTETVMPEDMNRIEENTKENNNALSEFKKQYNADSKEENKKIDRKAEKEDVILKVPYPKDRDCNSFKTLNAFCVFDTGIGDFKNTPEGTLAYGSSKVFVLTNRGYSDGRIQQEFVYVYPTERVTRWVRNYANDNENPWGRWYKVYDENNKPNPAEINAWDKTAQRLERANFNTITTGGIYATVNNTIERHSPVNYDGRLIVMSWNQGNWASQMFFADGGRIFTRTATNIQGTLWTDWTELYSRQSKPTPQEVGAINKNGDTMLGNLGMAPGRVFVGAHNFGFKCDTKEGTSAYVLYIDNDNKVHLGYGGRPIKIDAVDIVNQNNKKVYHEDNKPNPDDIGAIPNTGGRLTGNLEFVGANAPIKITGFQGANGIDYHKDSGERLGSIGMLGNTGKGELTRAYMGITASPWDGNKSLTVGLEGVYFDNQKIYYPGNKPSPQDIGAAPINHNHDSAYLGKTATAVDSNKLRGWLLAEASTKYRGVPFVNHDGVMELGHILDFHLPNSNADFDSRLEAGNGVLTMWGDFVATNQYIKKYLRIKDWYGGDQDAKLWYKQQSKGLYIDDVSDLFVGGKDVALGKWESTGGADIYLLGGTLRLVRQVITTGVANSGGGASYTIHFPKAWNWVQPISLVSDNMGNANTYTSGYCTIDAWSNSHLNGGCYQMVAGKSTRITLTYLAGV